MPEIRKRPTSLRDIVIKRKNARGDPEALRNMIGVETVDRWPYPNSSLLEDNSIDNRWNIPYNRSFRLVIPEGYSNIKDYIERTLAEKRGKAIGIELGGIGSNLFAGFTPGFFQRTAAISITDYRDRLDSRLKPADKARKHRVIEGDMLDPKTKSETEDFLAQEKADLIILRMYGGLKSLPKEPEVLANQVDYWYRHLAEGGIMFLEVPPGKINTYMKSWKELLDEQYQGRFELQYPNRNFIHTIRLRKLVGAPTRLPLVPMFERKGEAA